MTAENQLVYDLVLDLYTSTEEALYVGAMKFRATHGRWPRYTFIEMPSPPIKFDQPIEFVVHSRDHPPPPRNAIVFIPSVWNWLEVTE